MPLIFDTYETGDRLSLWHLTETVEQLESNASLSPNELLIYKQISNTKRKKEWLTVRLLLKEILGFWPDISYLETGRPILNNHPLNLSISHSQEMVGVLLSTSEHTGIDIEKKTRPIENVLPRFLSTCERSYLNNCTVPNAKIISWCAKEAIFKAVDETDIDFSTRILIEEISLNGTIKGKFLSNNGDISFNLKHIEVKDHVVVWTSKTTKS